MTVNPNISANIFTGFNVGGAKGEKKAQAEKTSTPSEGTAFKGEKGSDILAAMGMQGAQQLQLQQQPKTESLVFDPAALTAQIEGGALDSSTMEGLETLAQPGVLPMFAGFSAEIEGKPIGEQLALQDGLLKEFKA